MAISKLEFDALIRDVKDAQREFECEKEDISGTTKKIYCTEII